MKHSSQNWFSSPYLLLIVSSAALLLLSACDFVAASNPAIEPTPNLQATVEAMVNQRLAEKEPDDLTKPEVARKLTDFLSTEATPSANPTPTHLLLRTPKLGAQISDVEAAHRLHIYFEQQYQLAASEESKWFNYLANLSVADQFTMSSKPQLQDQMRLGMITATAQVNAWKARLQGSIHPEYVDRGAWVITLTNLNIDGVVQNFSEQWWLFEKPGTPPRLK